MTTKTFGFSIFLLCLSTITFAQKQSAQRIPIIDVHLHATNENAASVEKVLQQMEDHHVVLAVLSGADRELAVAWKASAPHKFKIGPSFPCTDGMYPRMYPCFPENNGWPDLDWLRTEYEDGRMSALGEMLYVYYGISPADKQLDPYFKLAAELSIPVGVHAGHGPPPQSRMEGCCPNFKEEMGNPLLLKPVLDKYPDLKIWLMHGGEINFHDQAIQLMKAYPNVYADMSILNSVMPAELHARLLKSFIDAGLEDRLMFGSDNLPYGLILKRLNELDFLSDKQRRGILYDNAARFFDLSEETKVKHLGN
ncbi:amidohydrolase family protein [Gracilimonas sp. BCB1]|uniref:amidohydrolase family protein n=1 Tax=Gracilimonas sp. BCB1 TaxID=3152362 RepID=UPI0032D99A6F